MAAIDSVSGTRVERAIAKAAERSGVDFDYLYKQAHLESGMNPTAQAKTSSASGLFQFTKNTWRNTVLQHGAEHGLGWAANAVASQQDLAAVDALRFEPEASAAMAGELAADNRSALEGALGREPEPVDLYLAHFLGAAGATKFLQAYSADPSTAAAPLLPQAAASNRAIFYTDNGTPRSVGEIRDLFAARMGAANAAAAPTLIPLRTQVSTTQAASSNTDRPMELANFERMPGHLSLAFAQASYAKLSNLP
ncbi:Transglycosylase SLT domain-containing protein [Sphingomonas antarctica]|uniref:transglycosylase SLT domain-containing protein n=1 Tax=Sphingomonas antarctica TaxID=2040274 RepID=UPI0039EC10BA